MMATAAASDEVRVPTGTILFRQGDPADDMFVISEGRARDARRQWLTERASAYPPSLSSLRSSTNFCSRLKGPSPLLFARSPRMPSGSNSSI